MLLNVTYNTVPLSLSLSLSLYHDDCMQFIYLKTAQQSLMSFISGRILKGFAHLLVL
jgi:hypothetical protein